MPRVLSLVVMLAVAACAGTSDMPDETPHAVKTFSPDFVRLVTLLSSYGTPELRAFFDYDFEERELHRVGFDGVTLAQCVDRVVAAIRVTR